jgi:hypothetical protein
MQDQKSVQYFSGVTIQFLGINLQVTIITFKHFICSEICISKVLSRNIQVSSADIPQT